jgi:mxaJ protein
MSSAYRFAAILVVVLSGALALASVPPLRVCADPNNLPFSNVEEQGFENVLARMVAHDLQRDIQFVWFPQQGHSMRKMVSALNCDLVMGINSASDLMATTAPYYRSTYVFISRQDRHLGVASLADRRLASYRIGAQVIGGDDASVPPAEELARRGLARNLVGYSIYGHPFDNPSAQMITAVEHGDVDMAVAWGPSAGYFAKESSIPLQITPICLARTQSAMPMVFAISIGVRRWDDLLLNQLNGILARRQKVIRTLLRSYGVPLVAAASGPARCR